MMKRFLWLLILVSASVQAMVFDNRFLPLYYKPHTRLLDAPNWLRIQPFFMHAERGFGDLERLNIPDIDGSYDSISIARSLTKVGFENPLRSDFLSRTSIPWTRKGRLDAQGVAFYYEHVFNRYVSLGFDVLFMHVSFRSEFLLRDVQTSPGEQEHIFQLKEKMHSLLGVTPSLFSRTGFGDIDLYLRFGNTWCYTCKFKRIDAALKLGTIIPSAEDIAINNPASLAFGGERRWGIYLGLDNEFEFKEDLIGGYVFRAIKRFEKTQCRRMPVGNEPSRYGPVVGPLETNPGWTFVFNPYFSLDNLREGLGLKVQYTLVSHLKDKLCDRRSREQRREIPVDLEPVKARSSWGTEHVTIGAQYDFGNVRGCPPLYPKISAYWDIPVDWLVAKRASKMHSVSLMVELDF